MKIGLKFIIVSIALGLCGTVVSIASFYVIGVEEVEKNTRAHLESVSTIKEQQIRNFVNERGLDIKELTYESVIVGAQDVEGMTSLLKKRVTQNSNFIELFVFDLSGRIIASSDEKQVGKYKNKADYLKNTDDTYIRGFHYSASYRGPTMVIARDVLDYEGVVVVTVAGRINPDRVSQIMLERSGLGETGETYLVNNVNVMLTDSAFESGTALKKTIYTEGVKRCVEGGNGYASYVDYRDKNVLGVYAWMQEQDMCLIAKIDEKEAFSSLHTLAYTVPLIALGSIVLISIFAYFLIRIMIEPIKKLQQATEKIGEGNLDIEIKINTEDEIGELARDFNAMTENLKKSRNKLEYYSKNLESEVKKRTEELENKNNELENFNAIMVGRELKMLKLKERPRELGEEVDGF